MASPKRRDGSTHQEGEEVEQFSYIVGEYVRSQLDKLRIEEGRSEAFYRGLSY